MNLDTRGFMDGAMRGFDMMERHFDRKDRKEERAQSLRQAELDRQENQRRYDSEQERLLRAEETNNTRYEQEWQWKVDQQAKQDKIQAQETAKNDALRAEQAKTAKANRLYTEKVNFLNDNAMLIQNAWQTWQTTGKFDPIFDNEHVKGGAYDVRKYSPDMVRASRLLENAIPSVLKGDIALDHPDLIEPLSVMYQSNVEKAIGLKTADGREITAAKLNKVNQVSDINPEQAGDQPGIVLTMKVTYNDGSQADVPVTQNRSTDPSDNVMVIPLESAMQDLTSQMKLVRQASASPFYGQLFKDPNAHTEKKDYRKEMIGIDKWHAEQYSKIQSDDSLINPEQKSAAIKALDERRDAMIANVNNLFGKTPSNEQGGQAFTPPKTNPVLAQWATTPEKAQFLKALANKGVDLSSTTAPHLESAYKSVIKEKQNRQMLADAQALRGTYSDY